MYSSSTPFNANIKAKLIDEICSTPNYKFSSNEIKGIVNS